MKTHSRARWIAAVVAVGLISGCAARTGSIPSSSTAVSATPAPTVSPMTRVSPSETPSLDPGFATLQGTWATTSVPVDAVLATVRESNVSDEQLAAYYRDAGAETVTFKLRFLGDQMAWIEVLDDGADETGVSGSYWIENGDTIVFPDTSGSGRVFVRFSVSGDTLTTSADPEAQTTADRKDPMALAAVAAWFNSAPYTRQAE